MHQEDVGAHARASVVINRAHFQVHRLEAAERALDDAQSLVGAHGVLGIELGGGHAGAHDVQAIEGGLGGDGVGLAVVGERGLGDVELEVFGHLVLADDLADPHGDLLLGAQAPLLALCRGGNGSEQGFGGL